MASVSCPLSHPQLATSSMRIIDVTFLWDIDTRASSFIVLKSAEPCKLRSARGSSDWTDMAWVDSCHLVTYRGWPIRSWGGGGSAGTPHRSSPSGYGDLVQGSEHLPCKRQGSEHLPCKRGIPGFNPHHHQTMIIYVHLHGGPNFLYHISVNVAYIGSTLTLLYII